MKALLTGIAFVFVMSSATFAQQDGDDWPPPDWCPWHNCQVVSHYGNCDAVNPKGCDRKALAQDAKIKTGLGLLVPRAKRPRTAKGR
jgi:hypothetical protein